MPFAVTLRLDATSAASVESVIAALAERGVSNSARRLGYQPHLTLAVCDDKTEQAAVIQAAQKTAGSWCGIRPVCAALSVFADPPIALFLVVTPAIALVQQHAALCEALPQDHLHPYYRPGLWLPHVTLADDLRPARVAAAMAAAQPAFRPFTAGFAQLDVVRFRPVKVVWQAALGTAGEAPDPASKMQPPMNADGA